MIPITSKSVRAAKVTVGVHDSLGNQAVDVQPNAVRHEVHSLSLCRERREIWERTM